MYFWSYFKNRRIVIWMKTIRKRYTASRHRFWYTIIQNVCDFFKPTKKRHKTFLLIKLLFYVTKSFELNRKSTIVIKIEKKIIKTTICHKKRT